MIVLFIFISLQAKELQDEKRVNGDVGYFDVRMRL
jgi:hypothetical protein